MIKFKTELICRTFHYNSRLKVETRPPQTEQKLLSKWFTVVASNGSMCVVIDDELITASVSLPFHFVSNHSKILHQNVSNFKWQNYAICVLDDQKNPDKIQNFGEDEINVHSNNNIFRNGLSFHK